MTTILKAIGDRNLFAPWFKDRATWAAWLAFLSALFALPMADEQLTIFKECTGRDSAPTTAAKEATLICGRRAGKSFILALCAVYLACFRDHRSFLTPGEIGTIPIIARDRKQSRVIVRYVRALLSAPLLKQMVVREGAESFDLDNSVVIEVHVASFRSTRGYTIVAALCDELAFWPTDDAANPDEEVLNALRPGMATIPTSLLLCASSPYAKRGALWTAHRKFFGKTDAPHLVWQASTRTMNPTVPQALVDAALEDDPASASAEYLGHFRSDVEGFASREAVEACVANNIYERAPVPGLRYVAFTDPSGGSADSFSLAIGHKDADVLVLDALREVRPPFSPESVTREFAAMLKTYRVTKVTGDRYAGEWPREQFRKHGIAYEPAARPKSDIYRDLLPLINSRRCELLDHPRLIQQLTNLERRTARSGRDSIDHPPGTHDDVANAVAGALLASLAPQQRLVMRTLEFPGGPRSVELDPRTGRPIEPDRPRVKWVKVAEAAVPSVKGPY